MLVVKFGESLVFEGRVCGSVGVEYRVECDETAFSVECSRRFLNPQKAFYCEGGDKAIATYKLTSLCVGEFDVWEVEGFRRKETSRTKYVVKVVPDEAKEYNEACELYKTLGAEKYTLYPYGKEALGEEMYVVSQVVCGCWKPRYLIDDRSKTAIEFMSEVMTLQTVGANDVDYESLNELIVDYSYRAVELCDVSCPTFKSLIGLQQYAISRAKRLNASYLTSIHNYKDGVAEVSWQLYPDDRYRTDEDGRGTPDDEKITLYGFVDRAGKPLVKFRYIYDIDELAEMEKEARKNLEVISRV